MSDLSNSLRHVSFDQVKAIVDFMEQHVEFAEGSLRTLEARHTSKKLWTELTRILNSSRAGTKKTADGWSRYWSDFKNKLKNKVNMLKKVKRLGSTAAKKQIRPLTKLEKRALVILGPHFEKKNCYNSVSEQLPAVVKLEASQESPEISYIPNNWAVTESQDNDKDLDADNDSNENADSNDGLDADSDDSTEEPLVCGIYPKWLVAIEKKRAEADYIRAKAEELRATASAKNAKAAVLQAEALRKLAEAAQTQAEAVMKIAIALENRDKRDDIMII
ncbi:uncharacterized protein [Epargyreus clarus]|uniref:uncharacterized protein n=1 Tax=Epargyreus clarus TaxID=520877 RepID=UPI003C30565D